MTRTWLPLTMLRAASLLAPECERHEWLEWWRSEVFYVSSGEATAFCMGAFRDAFWLRRNSLNQEHRTHLQSPLAYLAFLAVLAVASVAAASLLPIPELAEDGVHSRSSVLAMLCSATLVLISSLLLPAALLVMRWIPREKKPQWWLFLVIKILLVQPILVCGFLVMMAIQPFSPLVAQVVAWPILVWPFRFILLDQRRRCPVCLRLLTEPVRIGSPSRTFLEWYGAESACPRGHGLMHSPEFSASYSEKQRWLKLDSSWSGL